MGATHDGWYMLIAYAYEHAEKRIPTYIYMLYVMFTGCRTSLSLLLAHTRIQIIGIET